jgi:hypothetical protein
MRNGAVGLGRPSQLDALSIDNQQSSINNESLITNQKPLIEVVAAGAAFMIFVVPIYGLACART